MQTESYGVLKCRMVETNQIKGKIPHFHIHTIADDVHFRVSINVKSEAPPSELLYFIDYDFKNKLTGKLTELPFGFNEIGPNIKEEYGLDYIRGNLFDLNNMYPLPDELPGHDNDLNEKIRVITHKALQNQRSILYVFGKRWPTEQKKDEYFHFLPCEGIHHVHMNQGNSGLHEKTNGSWQDGGLLVHFLPEDRWSAIFLAFQTQSFQV